MNLEVSCTQDLPPDDSNHDLDTPKYGLWKSEYLSSLFLSLSRGGRRLSLKNDGNPKLLRGSL